MAAPDSHVKVTVAKARGRSDRPVRESTVSVAEWRITIGISEYVVVDSTRYAHPLGAADWSPAIHHQITECRRTGASKGRVLYLLEETGSVRVPVAVLGFHLESAKELEVRAAESALALKDRESALVKVLLVCADAILRQYPSRQGGARLVWKPPRSAVQPIREQYGFRRAGDTPDGRALLERKVSRT